MQLISLIFREKKNVGHDGNHLKTSSRGNRSLTSFQSSPAWDMQGIQVWWTHIEERRKTELKKLF